MSIWNSLEMTNPFKLDGPELIQALHQSYFALYGLSPNKKEDCERVVRLTNDALWRMDQSFGDVKGWARLAAIWEEMGRRRR